MILPFYEEHSMFELIIDRFISELNNSMPIIVATTESVLDDEIETIARRKKVNLFRGSENDVLKRFIKAAEKFNLDYVVRVCADNPLFDIQGTVALADYVDTGHLDYVGYKVTGEIPSILTHSGFWGEVVALSALKRANEEIAESFYREHVTNYVYQHPEKFSVKLVNAPDFLFFRDDIRLTVDTEADFIMMKEIYYHLKQENIPLVPEHIVQWIDKNPDYLSRMNKQIEMNRKV